MHIVEVSIKYKNKYGLSKQVGKSDIFTKSSLTKLHDKMRTLCIEEFNKEYNLNNSLKKKQKGRNRDYLVSEMDNYIEMKKGIEKHQKDLEVSNNKLIELDNNSNTSSPLRASINESNIALDIRQCSKYKDFLIVSFDSLKYFLKR